MPSNRVVHDWPVRCFIPPSLHPSIHPSSQSVSQSLIRFIHSFIHAFIRRRLSLGSKKPRVALQDSGSSTSSSTRKKPFSRINSSSSSSSSPWKTSSPREKALTQVRCLGHILSHTYLHTFRSENVRNRNKSSCVLSRGNFNPALN